MDNNESKPKEIQLPQGLRDKYQLNNVSSPKIITPRTKEMIEAGISAKEINFENISEEMCEKLSQLKGFRYITKKEKPSGADKKP